MSEVTARIKYSKLYPANLIGHLDTVKALQRSMRRAAWPLKFTCGFNPRIKLSFTPSLSLGFSSEAEYIDVALNCPLEEYQIERFNNSSIQGIRIKDVQILSGDEPGINEKLKGFRYMVEFLQGNIEETEELKNVVERGKNYIILDVLKKNGGFRNPVKLLGAGEFKIKKIKCLWR